MRTVGALLDETISRDPTRPLLTYYDDRTGERTELSGATLGNWVAKTANLLVEGVGLDAGDEALVLLPPHWLTAAVVLGSWASGVMVVDTPPARVGFATLERVNEVTVSERYIVNLHPLALPLPPGALPAGCSDFTAEVRTFGDRFAPPVPISPDDRATGTLDHAGLRAAARERAGSLGIGAGDRVLIDAARHPDPLDWLLAPLEAGASIVLCGHLDAGRLARRSADERVSLSLTG